MGKYADRGALSLGAYLLTAMLTGRIVDHIVLCGNGSCKVAMIWEKQFEPPWGIGQVRDIEGMGEYIRS